MILKVRIKERTFTRYLDFERMGVRLEVEDSYSFSVDGGPKQAVIKAYGTAEALQQLFQHLRGAVEIYDGADNFCWWGFLWSVSITDGADKYGFTLDGMGNSISIIYLQQTINQSLSGAGTAAETGFSTDAASIAEYGTKQLRLRGTNASATAATTLRAAELARRANPLPMTPEDTQGAETFAVLTCRGWIDTLSWRYYTNNSGNAAGFEQNSTTASEAEQPLGLAAPAKTTIAFHNSSYAEVIKRNSLEDESSTFALSSDSYVFVEGSTSGTNDLVWQMAGSPQGGRVYTLTTPPSVTEQASGASVTVKVVGSVIWQTFELETNNPFYAAAIDIRCKKYNLPTDNITVALYSVSGGLPNALLATGTISNGEVQTYMAWATAVLDAEVLLSFGVTYGIRIVRSSPTSDYNGFVIGVDTGLSYSRGSLQLYTNSTNGWKTRPTDADLIFKVAGVVQTTDQLSTVVTSVGEFITAVQIDDASGIRTLPYQDGTLTAGQIVRNLLDKGTSGSKRLLSKVTPERILVIYQEPTQGSAADYLKRRDGSLRLRNGDPIPEYHRGAYGQWAKLESLELSNVPTKYVFLDETSYNPKTEKLKIVRGRDQFAAANSTGVRQ